MGTLAKKNDCKDILNSPFDVQFCSIDVGKFGSWDWDKDNLRVQKQEEEYDAEWHHVSHKHIPKLGNFYFLSKDVIHDIGVPTIEQVVSKLGEANIEFDTEKPFIFYKNKPFIGLTLYNVAFGIHNKAAAMLCNGYVVLVPWINVAQLNLESIFDEDIESIVLTSRWPIQ